VSSFHAALRAAALVTQMAVQTVVGAYLGSWLDGWLGSTPVAVLVLGGAGFASGLLVTWRAFVQASPDPADGDDPPDPHNDDPGDPT